MRPFPFNLTGPEFLFFFAVFGLCVALFAINSPSPAGK